MSPKISKKQKMILLSLILFSVLSIQIRAQIVDATSLDNKVMAGYQGWFRVPSDPLGNGKWSHTFNAPGTRATPNGQNQPQSTPPHSPTDPSLLAFDTWPDMSEYNASEKYIVPGYTYPNGKPAALYSALNYQTVLRHFLWMKQYGLDGVWLSQFCGHFKGGSQASDTTFGYQVMLNVKKAAEATGRTWAFMWDMSSFNQRSTKEEVYNIIVDQWKKMVDNNITSDPRYLHHNGKPVLLIWGFFPNRPASQPAFTRPVVDFIQAPGKYQGAIVGGVETKWRNEGTPEFLEMLATMTAIQPWSVGRVKMDPKTGYKTENMDTWAGDIEWCKQRNILFSPVFNPGTHIAGPPPVPPKVPTVPRRTGNFLWEQFVEASKYKLNCVFVAMFDEINEGTQIMKIENHPPVQAPFLTYDGATSDFYLRLTGAGAKMLKEQKTITFPIPVSPFDSKKTYSLINKGLELKLYCNGRASKTAILTSGPSSNWQILYDGNGYFTIRDKASGKVLGSSEEKSPVRMISGSEGDNGKWHLEWDGTGFCRIISKKGNLSLCCAENQELIQIKSPSTLDELKARNDLRWQIIEQ
jgi:hypothetical protein